MAHTSGAGWTDKKVNMSAPKGYKKVPSEPSHTHPGAVRRTWKPVLSSVSQQATPDKQVGTGVLVPSHWPDQGHLFGTCLWVWKRRVLTRNKIISTKISCWHLLCCCYNVTFSYTVEHCHSLFIVILPTLQESTDPMAPQMSLGTLWKFVGILATFLSSSTETVLSKNLFQLFHLLLLQGFCLNMGT